MPKEKKKTKAVKKRLIKKKPSLKKVVLPEAAPLKEEKEEKREVLPKEKEKGKEVIRYYGRGGRKTSIARVNLIKADKGEGKIIINGKLLSRYVCGRKLLETGVLRPLVATNTLGSYDVIAKVEGGGIASQAGAVSLGISRALLMVNPDFRGLLRPTGMLSRDPRMKERKKYGRKRARKRFQYSKR